MVRVNLVKPESLADQHLVAEYDEILMLLGYVRRFPKIKTIKGISEIPENYTLNKGHIKFFKNKLLYLKKRHETLKVEMRKRNFVTHITIELDEFNKEHLNDWKPEEKDFKIIKTRIIEKLHKKPDYYRYYGEYKPKEFFIELIKKG